MSSIRMTNLQHISQDRLRIFCLSFCSDNSFCGFMWLFSHDPVWPYWNWSNKLIVPFHFNKQLWMVWVKGNSLHVAPLSVPRLSFHGTWILMNKIYWNFTQNSKAFFRDNVVCKMAAILFRPQGIKWAVIWSSSVIVWMLIMWMINVRLIKGLDDNVMTWHPFPHNWSFVRRIYRSTIDSLPGRVVWNLNDFVIISLSRLLIKQLNCRHLGRYDANGTSQELSSDNTLIYSSSNVNLWRDTFFSLSSICSVKPVHIIAISCMGSSLTGIVLQ